jgi:hypothetical protein
MRARVVSLLFLTLLPSLTLAQRGGMGGMGGRRGGGRTGGDRAGTNREAPKFPEAKDLQKYNPAALIVDKRKKLSLSDSQVGALKALELRINERNAPLLVRYDSVRRDYRPPRDEARDATSASSDSTRRTAMTEMQFMRTLLDSLQERRRDDVRETLDLFADQKLKMKAAGFIDEQDKQFADAMPQITPLGSRRRQ